ncbi:MAG: winged helix-turn-helix transcriptional regulator [Candidatus Thorarchaeota archaeon]|jgi:DNA-binding HxlR family transcriptional regulator
MKKTCPIYNVVGFMGKRWTLLILTELYKGRTKWKRYSQIKTGLEDMTPKMLSTRLKELKSNGLITKRVDAKVFPIKSEYRLTDRGEDFIRIIVDMKKWALKWEIKNAHCDTVNCKDCKF